MQTVIEPTLRILESRLEDQGVLPLGDATFLAKLKRDNTKYVRFYNSAINLNFWDIEQGGSYKPDVLEYLKCIILNRFGNILENNFVYSVEPQFDSCFPILQVSPIYNSILHNQNPSFNFLKRQLQVIKQSVILKLKYRILQVAGYEIQTGEILGNFFTNFNTYGNILYNGSTQQQFYVSLPWYITSKYVNKQNRIDLNMGFKFSGLVYRMLIYQPRIFTIPSFKEGLEDETG